MPTEVKHKKSEHEKAIRTKERVRSTEEEKREDNLGKQFLMCLMEVQETLRCKRGESQRNGV